MSTNAPILTATLAPVKLAVAQCLQDNSNDGRACDAAADLVNYGVAAMPTAANTSAAMAISAGAVGGVVTLAVTANSNISVDPTTPDTLTYTSGLDASETKLTWAIDTTAATSVPAKFVK